MKKKATTKTTTVILSSPFQIRQYCKTCNQITRIGKPENIYTTMNYIMSQRFKSPGQACIPQAKDVTVTLLQEKGQCQG